MAIVRTALLHVPAIDDAVGTAVHAILLEYVPSSVIIQSAAAPDQRNVIAEAIRRSCDEAEIDLLITLGGISIAPGISDDESVPLAMADVVEREVPGMGEAMRAFALEEEPYVLLENAQAGIRCRTLIVNLPSDEKLAPLFLEAIADLLEPIVERLQVSTDASQNASSIEKPPSDEVPTAASDSTPERKSLDEADFAAFLAQRRPKSD